VDAVVTLNRPEAMNDLLDLKNACLMERDAFALLLYHRRPERRDDRVRGERPAQFKGG